MPHPDADNNAVTNPIQAHSPGRRVLSKCDIAHALRRIAHEIIDHNKEAGGLVILGIPTRGDALAHRLVGLLAEVKDSDVFVGSLDVTMYRDDLRRQPTRTAGHTMIPVSGIDDKVVVLVDDVLYSGRTVRAALDALGDFGRPRAVRLAVLVDRGHRELPIRTDHVGKHLPTTKSERVRVCLAEEDGSEEVRIVGRES